MPKLPTLFQKLNQTLGGGIDATIGQNGISNYKPSSNNIYNFSSSGDKGKNLIFSTNNKNEYDKKMLELKQQRYLSNQWHRSNRDLANKQFAGLSQVQIMYRDVELMDAFPEIGAALDIYADESCVTNNDGQIVNVISKSSRIKSIIEDLLTNRLALQLTAPMVIRAMCKYGNEYMLLNIDKENGVLGWKQMPVMEIERHEAGLNNPYSSYGTTNKKNKSDDVEFTWLSNGNDVYKNWQMGHFRLITDGQFLPYGCLKGDTRIETEDGYKEIQYIEPGDKVWSFNIKTKSKELGVVTLNKMQGVKDTYTIKTRHNYIVGTDNHPLLVYDKPNDSLIYKQIKDLKINDLLVVDNQSNKHLGTVEIDKTPITSEEANLKKSTLWWKNKKFIPDYVDEDFAKFFGFMIGDGWISHNGVYFALGEYNSLNKEFIDYLQKISGKQVKLRKNSHNHGKLEYTQAMVYSKTLKVIMERMNFKGKFDTKRIPKWLYKCNDSIKKAFLDGLILADGSYNIDKYNCMRCSIEMSNEELIKDIKILVQSLGYKSGQIAKRDRHGKKLLANGKYIQSKNTAYYFYFYESHNKQEKKYSIDNISVNNVKTELIHSIEYAGKEKTYDITIGNDNANFFANGIVTHNCSILHKARRHFRMLSMMEDMMLIYRLDKSIERRVYKIYVGAIDDKDVPAYVEEIANEFKRTPIVDPQTGQLDLRKNLMSVDSDIFIPVRDANASNPIDTLAAGQNLTSIDDIKYIQGKVLCALRIPKSFLNFDESVGQGQNLSLLDVRFSRVINRIQQAFLMELSKIVTIHLYILGFKDDLTNFTLTMNNPSTQAEQLEIDNFTKKISTFRDAVTDPGTGVPIMSMTKAWRSILKWSDDDISTNLQELRLEKAISDELKKTSQIIKRTGLFDATDNTYGETGAQYMDNIQGDENSDGGLGVGMGSGMGGGLDTLGGVGDETAEGELSGEEANVSPNEADNQNVDGAQAELSNGTTSNEAYEIDKPLVNELSIYDELIGDIGNKNANNTKEKISLNESKSLINPKFDEILNDIDIFLKK